MSVRGVLALELSLPDADQAGSILHTCLYPNQWRLHGVFFPVLFCCHQTKNATFADSDHRLFGAFLLTYWLTLFPSRKSVREAQLLCIMTVSLIQA